MEQILLDRPESQSLLGVQENWPEVPSGHQRQSPPGPWLAGFPAIKPGELCLLSIPATASTSIAFGGALMMANVIIYDRSLTQLVAGILPLGGYAEPAVGDGLERSVRFARDGRSVVRLLEADSVYPRLARYGRWVAAGVRAAGAPADLAVTHLTDAAGSQVIVRAEATVADVGVLLGNVSDADPHAILFGAFACACTAALSVTVANGLAG